MLLAALLLGAAASSPVLGHSAEAELDAVEREKARMAAQLEGAAEEVQEAGQTLAEAEALLPDAEEAVAAAEGRVAAAEAVATEAEEQAEAAQEALEAAEDELEAAAAAVEEAKNNRITVLTATYRGAELLTVDAILASDDTLQAMDRLSYLEFLIDAKNAAVEEVTLTRRNAANAEGAASRARTEAAVAEAEAAATLDAAEERYSEAQVARETVTELVDERADALAVAEAAEAQAQAEYEELEAASERLADALREADPPDEDEDSGDDSSSDDSSSGDDASSGFVQPVSGWKSSNFGWRTHPIYGTSRFHSGTDFAAAKGTAIHAADSGTVVQAGWNGGYGMLTCISHGDGLTTCYGHQSSIWVENGEHVDQDEEIGAVGSTGASTGAHLHFEVRVDGEPVEPLDYLPSCLCR
ncbi:M23 family metallopeptidase [Glycomyces arizonensis]|uniref:M23 family metallopeptidase n=1 Tax=Glycomyces arizonensis TaxID=256035 RepID=UPI00041B4B86|nr:M23 family metallopeptidase [Glycomyces arizonensis]